jgi:hypothetical protein
LRIVYRLFYIGNFNEKVWAKSFEENVFIWIWLGPKLEIITGENCEKSSYKLKI